MAFSFTLNAGKVWAFLQSLGSEFQTVAPLYAKLFCPNFVSLLGDLDLNWNYEAFCSSLQICYWKDWTSREALGHLLLYKTCSRTLAEQKCVCWSYLKPGLHIVVSDGDVPASTGTWRRCIGDVIKSWTELNFSNLNWDVGDTTGRSATSPKKAFPHHRKRPSSIADPLTGTRPRHLWRYGNQA